jgi:hypothetical protein
MDRRHRDDPGNVTRRRDVFRRGKSGILRTFLIVEYGDTEEWGRHRVYGALLSLIFVVDLALFVLVFLIVRTRIRAERIAAVIVLSAAAYLVSLVLLIFVSFRM